MKKNYEKRGFVAIAMTLAAIVLSVLFSACGEEDLARVQQGTDPVPPVVNPSWKAESLETIDCAANGISWKSSNNVTISSSRAAYADSDMEGYINSIVTHKYVARVKYSDKNGQQPDRFEEMTNSYTSSLMSRIYGLSTPMVFDSLEALNAATGKVSAENAENGYELYSINFGGSRQVVLKNNVTMSTSSLSFAGLTVSDLCTADFAKPEYVDKAIRKVSSDREGYDQYTMVVTIKLTIANVGNDNNVRYISFEITNVYVKNDNGGDQPGIIVPDKEQVGYGVRNNKFNGTHTIGDVVVIFDDLSEEKILSFKVALNHSTVTPQDVTQNGLSNLDWSVGQTTTINLAATGASREVSLGEGCKISVTEVFSSVTNRSKVPMTFKGIWEQATILFPDGTSATLSSGGYEMEDGEVTEISSSETSKTIKHSAYAEWNNGTPETLTAKVVLNKATVVEPENIEIGIIIENFVPSGTNYQFDIVHYWTISAPTRESVSIPNYASLTAEDEKFTTSRNYNVSTPNMVVKNTESYQSTTAAGSKINGTVTTYNSNFVFEGAAVKTTSKYLNNFTVTSKSGNKAVWDIKTQAIKTGVTLGTANYGEGSDKIYKDKIHFALPINNVNVATAEQILVFTEKGQEPEPTPDPVTDKDVTVIENTIAWTNNNWVATMKIQIENSLGAKRDSTMTRVYSEAGVTYDSIKDIISKDKSFTKPVVPTSGQVGSYQRGDITYTRDIRTAKADKFNHKITIINGSSSVKILGKTLNFKSTSIGVEALNPTQAETATYNNGYDVWASAVHYRHGFNEHYEEATTNFNILVERAPVGIEIDADKIIAAAITITVDRATDRETFPMVTLMIQCSNKCIEYSSPCDFKDKTPIVNLDQTPRVHAAFNFANIPSATNNGIGTARVPANLIVGDGEWAYYAADGYIRFFSKKDALTTGCHNPVIAVGELLSDGRLKIQNGNDIVYFSVK